MHHPDQDSDTCQHCRHRAPSPSSREVGPFRVLSTPTSSVSKLCVPHTTIADPPSAAEPQHVLRLASILHRDGSILIPGPTTLLSLIVR